MNLAGFVDAEGVAAGSEESGKGVQQGLGEVGGNPSGGVRVDGVDGETASLEGISLPGLDRSVDGASSHHLTSNTDISRPGLDGPGYDSWAPPSPPAQAQRDASGWDDPRPVPLAQPATEGWDSVRPTMAVNYGWDAPRPVASSGEW